MKVYITAKFKGDENKDDIEALCESVRVAGFEDFCFIRDVEQYQRGVFSSPQELMDRAKTELEACDALLIDITHPSTGGRLIEVGMAFAAGKKIIVIAKKDTMVGVPIAGVADHILAYTGMDDLTVSLRQLVAQTSAKTD